MWENLALENIPAKECSRRVTEINISATLRMTSSMEKGNKHCLVGRGMLGNSGIMFTMGLGFS